MGRDESRKLGRKREIHLSGLQTLETSMRALKSESKLFLNGLFEDQQKEEANIADDEVKCLRSDPIAIE